MFVVSVLLAELSLEELERRTKKFIAKVLTRTKTPRIWQDVTTVSQNVAAVLQNAFAFNVGLNGKQRALKLS